MRDLASLGARLLPALLLPLLAGCFGCGAMHSSTSGIWTEPGLYALIGGVGSPGDPDDGGQHYVGPLVPGGSARFTVFYNAPIEGGTVEIFFSWYVTVRVLGRPLEAAEPAFLDAWSVATGDGESGPAVFRSLLANVSAMSPDQAMGPIDQPLDWTALLALGDGWEPAGLGFAVRSQGPWTIEATIPTKTLSGRVGDGTWTLAVDPFDQARFSMEFFERGTVEIGEARAALAEAFAGLGLPPPASRLPDEVLLQDTREDQYCS